MDPEQQTISDLLRREFAFCRLEGNVSLFEDESVKKVTHRFRNTVLGQGSILPAEDIFRQFRGRHVWMHLNLADFFPDVSRSPICLLRMTATSISC